MNISSTQSLNYSKFTRKKKKIQNILKTKKPLNLKLQQIPRTLVDTSGSIKLLQQFKHKFLRYIACMILIQDTFSTCCSYMVSLNRQER